MALFTLYGLSAALHYYVWARIAADLPGVWAAPLFTALIVVSALLMPMGMAAKRLFSQPLADTLAWAGLLAMGLFSSLFVFTAVRDVVLLAGFAGSFAVASLVPTQGFQQLTALMVALLGIGVTIAGFVNARRTAGVVTVEVKVAGLPAALDGFTIVQISDIHIGPTIRGKQLDRIVDAVNSQNADVVAITGDLVDGSVPELQDHVAPLGRLQSRTGSFFVTGNHEYYSGVLPWMAELRRLGIHVLHNEHVTIDRDGAALVLAGVTDFNAGHFDESHRSDPAAALAGAPGHAAVKILLAHQPRSAPAAAEAGFDLQLSGHTHGGQFWPWNHFVRFQQPFTAGLHRLDELQIYVSRGTGYWGPPKRFGAPSEITTLRLVPA
ncbi:metallophosphoesterase [Caenimonas sp. SL110]|uniref:metallophosphoesterase n=1 Tax=Caenimonas sp. SL110 TaxID=1450524 RepID=UPI0006541360|nr:metallophosphoesterase [Caenimonas sp. SL110]